MNELIETHKLEVKDLRGQLSKAKVELLSLAQTKEEIEENHSKNTNSKSHKSKSPNSKYYIRSDDELDSQHNSNNSHHSEADDSKHNFSLDFSKIQVSQ